MKNHKNLVLILLVMFAVVGAAATSRLQTKNGQKDLNEHKKLVEAMRRGGYREAAKIKGHYVTKVDPNWDWASFDLESLTKNSVGIVVGVPNLGTGRLNPDGDVITTQYEVMVKKVIRGSIRRGEIVEVALLGGKVDFEDGTSAEAQTPEFEKMVKGKEYVLFLHANKNGSPVFLITGGTQGLFEVTDSKKIKPHARPTDTVSSQSADKDVEVFLKEIEAYAMKWPETNGCCR